MSTRSLSTPYPVTKCVRESLIDGMSTHCRPFSQSFGRKRYDVSTLLAVTDQIFHWQINFVHSYKLRRDHITLVLRHLHWLAVERRVEFKIAFIVHQSLSSKAPTYLTADIRLVSEHGCRSLRSSSNRTLAVHGHAAVLATEHW